MAAERYKRFKDPVHGYITVPLEICHSIIDTPLFQRLRHIEQTSMRSLYPGARHDRFVHSLGVYHLGCRAAQRIEEVLPDDIKGLGVWDCYRKTFEIACLMHDCGHAPFSHTCEKFYNHKENVQSDADKHPANTWLLEKCQSDGRFSKDFSMLPRGPADHEAFSAALMIEFFQTEISVLNAESILAARMITGCCYDDPEDDKQRLANCLISLLHDKAIDVDKLDYLLRDTWASGVKNVAIDIDRLLHGIGIKKHDNRICLYHDKSSLSVVQSVVDARNYLHDWVFTHHTVTYYTHLLDCSLRKLATIIGEGDPDKFWTGAFSVTPFRAPFRISSLATLYLPTDGDIISLLKSFMYADLMVTEFLSHKPTRVTLWKTRAEFERIKISDELNTTKRRNGLPSKLKEFCEGKGWGAYLESDFLVVDASSSHLQITPSAILIDMGEAYGLMPYTTVMGIPANKSDEKFRTFYIYVPKQLRDHKQELITRVKQCFTT